MGIWLLCFSKKKSGENGQERAAEIWQVSLDTLPGHTTQRTWMWPYSTVDVDGPQTVLRKTTASSSLFVGSFYCCGGGLGGRQAEIAGTPS